MKYLVINPETYRVVLKEYNSIKYFNTAAGAKRSLIAKRKRVAKLRDKYIADFPGCDTEWANATHVICNLWKMQLLLIKKLLRKTNLLRSRKTL